MKPNPRRVTGLILAGGLSRRFDRQDKTFAELGGKPLIAHVIERLAPQVDELLINSNGEAERFASFHAPVIADTIEGHIGPLAGLLAGLQARPHHYIMAVSVDMPFLPVDLTARLMTNVTDQRCSYASFQGQHAVALLCPPGLADTLQDFLVQGGQCSVKRWLAQHGTPVEIEPTAGSDIRININTALALAEAEQRLQGL